MRGKRLLWYALGLLSVCVVVFFLLHHRSGSGSGDDGAVEARTAVPDVSVVHARVGGIAQQLAVAGIFQPFQEIDVHGKVSGYIRRIYVDVGDRVHKGQTLAVLEVPELDAQVAGARAGINQAQQQIARLESNVAGAQANYSATHANYMRLKQASDQQPGLVAAQELDDARARDQTAQAQIEESKSAVSAARAQLGVAGADQMRVTSLAQYATITAPYTGVITMRYADTGALVPAGTAEGNAQAVVRLAQSDVLRLRMPIPERDVPLVRVGSVVMVHVQATGQQFPGKVVRFARDVSDATRTMMTEVDVPNPTLALTPGMYADVTFDLKKKNDALIVPAASIIQGDQPAVMVVDGNGRVQRRPVVLGIRECKPAGGDLRGQSGRRGDCRRPRHAPAQRARSCEPGAAESGRISGSQPERRRVIHVILCD